jgi:hypothetical protein
VDSTDQALTKEYIGKTTSADASSLSVKATQSRPNKKRDTCALG